MKPERLAVRLFSDWPAKVLSLFAALLLAVVFNLTRLEQRSITIPLSVVLNDQFAPSSQYPRTVKVVLKGERDVIYGIREDEISASLDLSGLKSEGVYRVAVKLEKRGGALAADPLEIRPDPQEVAVGIENRVRKKVPVTPSFKGFLESGYELTSFDLSPSDVVVSGPAGLVAQTSELSTDIIELSGKKTDFSVEVRLVKKDNLLTIEGRDTVVFSAKVKHALDVNTYPGVKIGLRGLSPLLSLAEPLPLGSLRLHLPEGAADSLNVEDILSVDLSGISKPGVYSVSVAVHPPEGVLVETYEPQTLTLRLQGPQSGAGRSQEVPEARQ